MVTVYGLNEEIGNISFYDSSGQSEYSFQKPYSEKTAEKIDQEVKKLVDEAYARTKEILLKNQDHLKQLAELLLEKEVIFKDDLEKIFGKRAYDAESRSEQLLKENQESEEAEKKKQLEQAEGKKEEASSESKSEETKPSITSNGQDKPKEVDSEKAN